MKKQLGLVIDQERCIGCEACTVACIKENNPTAGPWIHVKTIGGEQKDTPSGRYPNLQMDFLPHLCMHCIRPPCVEVCPTNALWKREDGVVVLDNEKCDDCQECIGACPYGSILYSPEKGLVEKCDLCDHRIDQGLEPFCVVCCEGQAMYFGDLNDTTNHVYRLISSRKALPLRSEAGTGPSVYYCPPRERRRL